MNESLEKDFSKTIDSLNELIALIDSNNFPKITEIVSRVNSLKNEYRKSLELNSHPHVRAVLENELDAIVLEFAEKQKDLGLINFSIEENISIDNWNRIISSSRKILNLIALMNPKGQCDFTFGHNGFEIIVAELGEFDIDQVRPRAYALTREFLDQSMIFTFDVRENSLVEFSLRWDEDNNELLVFYNLEKKLEIGMPALLSKFVIESQNLSKRGQHLVYTFDQDFNFRRVENDVTPELSSTVTVLHFSFLFRPLSLIIPMKGQVLPAVRVSEKPGWLPLWSEQDVGKVEFQFIDWFKLIQS
ncbi:MAG: hypothetical protein Fur0010_13740 [Bdellovibrio sp.]